MALSVTPDRRRKSEALPAALPSAGGAALRAASPAHGPAEWGSPAFADSEPWRGPFGPLGVPGTAAPSEWISGPELTLTSH
eukprot:10015896-Alexandrium_andersonii.AAC.1